MDYLRDLFGGSPAKSMVQRVDEEIDQQLPSARRLTNIHECLGTGLGRYFSNPQQACSLRELESCKMDPSLKASITLDRNLQRDRTLAGLLPSLGCVYFAVGQTLWIWKFKGAQNIWSKKQVKGTVISLICFQPNKKVFHSGTENAMAVATTHEVAIYKIDYDEFGRVKLVESGYSISNKGHVKYTTLLSGPNGRILMGGTDGSVYEFSYSDSEKKCETSNCSSTIMSGIASGLATPISWFLSKEESQIKSMKFGSKEREVGPCVGGYAYILKDDPSIEVYDLGQDGKHMVYVTKNSSIHDQVIKQLAKQSSPAASSSSSSSSSSGSSSSGSSSAANNEVFRRLARWWGTGKNFKVIDIFPLSPKETEKAVIVLVTAEAARVYYVLENRSLKILHVRPPMRNMSQYANMTIDGESPDFDTTHSKKNILKTFHSPGVFGVVFKEDRPNQLTLATFRGVDITRVRGVEEAVEKQSFESKQCEDVAEIPAKYYTGNNLMKYEDLRKQISDLSEYDSQFFLPGRRFAVLKGFEVLLYHLESPIETIIRILENPDISRHGVFEHLISIHGVQEVRTMLTLLSLSDGYVNFGADGSPDINQLVIRRAHQKLEELNQFYNQSDNLKVALVDSVVSSIARLVYPFWIRDIESVVSFSECSHSVGKLVSVLHRGVEYLRSIRSSMRLGEKKDDEKEEAVRAAQELTQLYKMYDLRCLVQRICEGLGFLMYLGRLSGAGDVPMRFKAKNKSMSFRLFVSSDKGVAFIKDMMAHVDSRLKNDWKQQFPLLTCSVDSYIDQCYQHLRDLRDQRDNRHLYQEIERMFDIALKEMTSRFPFGQVGDRLISAKCPLLIIQLIVRLFNYFHSDPLDVDPRGCDRNELLQVLCNFLGRILPQAEADLREQIIKEITSISPLSFQYQVFDWFFANNHNEQLAMKTPQLSYETYLKSRISDGLYDFVPALANYYQAIGEKEKAVSFLIEIICRRDLEMSRSRRKTFILLAQACSNGLSLAVCARLKEVEQSFTVLDVVGECMENLLKTRQNDMKVAEAKGVAMEDDQKVAVSEDSPLNFLYHPQRTIQTIAEYLEQIEKKWLTSNQLKKLCQKVQCNVGILVLTYKDGISSIAETWDKIIISEVDLDSKLKTRSDNWTYLWPEKITTTISFVLTEMRHIKFPYRRMVELLERFNVSYRENPSFDFVVPVALQKSNPLELADAYRDLVVHAQDQFWRKNKNTISPVLGSICFVIRALPEHQRDPDFPASFNFVRMAFDGCNEALQKAGGSVGEFRFREMHAECLRTLATYAHV